MITLKFYVVRNRDGKFFGAKGFQGYGDTWVDDIEKAKVYTKIGQAKSRCTWFANEYPKFGVPDIIELSVFDAKVIDCTKWVEKSQKRKAKREAEQEKRIAEYRLKAAEDELKKAKENLDIQTEGWINVIRNKR